MLNNVPLHSFRNVLQFSPPFLRHERANLDELQEIHYIRYSVLALTSPVPPTLLADSPLPLPFLPFLPFFKPFLFSPSLISPVFSPSVPPSALASFNILSTPAPSPSSFPGVRGNPSESTYSSSRRSRQGAAKRVPLKNPITVGIKTKAHKRVTAPVRTAAIALNFRQYVSWRRGGEKMLLECP